MPLFQSSPDPKAGCDTTLGASWAVAVQFQSSPDPKAGCDGAGVPRLPGCRPVSILTRPEGRVRPATSPATSPAVRCFNPHPTRRPGATPFAVLRPVGYSCFNPHPTRRPGATSHPPSSPPPARSFNPHPTRRPGATVTGAGSNYINLVFQSSPDPKAGCDSPRWALVAYAVSSFNPHPTRRPGATVTGAGSNYINLVFQSSPDPKAGCDAPP